MKNKPLVDRFVAARLYAITCAPNPGQSYDSMVEAACVGGSDVIQFRDKILSTLERHAIAKRLRSLCKKHGALFIVNDDIALALSVEADGVHLGQDDLPVSAARPVVERAANGPFLIGKSTHTLEQARAASKEGADYIGIGPVFATPTKPTYEPVGFDLLRNVIAAVHTPHVAIGGIDMNNVAQVLEAGAHRVAVVRAVCGANDIGAEAKRMKTILVSHKGPSASR